MCANIKALLCGIEDRFNMGYLCYYSDTEIELLITTGQRHVSRGNHHSYTYVFMYTCELLLLYSDQPEQGQTY